MTTFRPAVARASLDRPPIDRLQEPGPNVLAGFVERRARRWGGAPVPLASAVTAAVWVLLLSALALGGGMLAVRSGVTPCGGPLCSIVTLADHPVFTLVLSGTSAAALLAASAVTRGLTAANGPQLAVVVLGALGAVVALAGVLALLLGVAIVAAIVVTLVDRL